MGTVTNLNPAKETGEFLDFLYGVEDGFVYLPTKDPEVGTWFESWFKWPIDRNDVIHHVQILSKTREVYSAPVVYTKPVLDSVYIKGSNVVWAEFDGEIPTRKLLDKKGSPTPTVRVRSSKPGHEHFYWRLEKFSTDLKSIQDTNKALAYALGADPTGWDIEQVLRPAGSLNHKRDECPVGLVTNTYKFYDFNSFDLPPVEINYSVHDFDASSIPIVDNVLLKYAWQSSEIELIKSEAVKGQRSSMLTKLGYMCCEKGLDNGEIYAILSHVDERWGKFSKRTNKRTCYIRLIDYVRQKHPYKSETDPTGHVKDLSHESYRLQGFMSHFRNTEPVEWIIEGLLHNSSILYFVGRAGSLKTALAMELGMNLSLNRSILTWENLSGRPLKILMWSLEMSGPEVQVRQEKIVERYDEEEHALLEDNFLIYSDPDPLRLYDHGDVEKFRKAIIESKPDGIIIDSASFAFSVNMSDEEVVKKAVQFLQHLRHVHKFFAIIIHHPRKDIAGVKTQRMSLSDMFGSQALENSATTVIGMMKRDVIKPGEGQRIGMVHLKTRFSEVPGDYDIELNKEDFTFSRPVITLKAPNTSPALDIPILDPDADVKTKPKRGDANGPGLTF